MPNQIVLRYPPDRPVSRVRIAPGGMRTLGPWTRATTRARAVAVVSDSRVAALYAGKALTSLKRAGIHPVLVTVPPGERSKRVSHLERLWSAFGEMGLDRRDGVVALGGGMVGDLAGFAAATWMRGLPWVNVPTSLLAQVDSSVGGKTAIDLDAGKNLAGAFHQPAGVLVDPDTLGTLDMRQLRAGLAEVVKAGMAVDAGLFRWTERHADALMERDSETLLEVVRRAIAAKARIVRQDPRERPRGKRTALNYGHTVAHALEAALGFRTLLHGEAVALGMRVAGRLSVTVAGLRPVARQRLDALLDRFQLPRTTPSVAAADIVAAIACDKKRDGRRVGWVLTPRIGHASVPRPIGDRLVHQALLEIGARG